MVAEFRQSAGATSLATPVSVTLSASGLPTSQSFLLVAVAINSTTVSVSSMSAGTATFVRCASLVGTAVTVELWLGYNFGTSVPSTLSVSRGAGSIATDVLVRVVDVFGDAVSAPTIVASSGNSATSTAPDSNSLTPAVGDILFAACGYGSNTAPTVYASTGNTYVYPLAQAGNTLTVSSASCEATSTSSSKFVWTVPSLAWAAIQAKITYAYTTPPAATAALVVKGLATAALDQAASF